MKINKFILIASSMVLGLGLLTGVASAFNTSVGVALAADGYTQTNLYTYKKTTGGCITTVQESGSKYYIFTSGTKHVTLWPVNESNVVQAADLVTNICST